MTNSLNFARKALRGGTALQALALLGAGVGMVSIAAPAVAQDYTNVTASGRVQGTNGQPIVGATVVITSNDQGGSRTVTTDGSGSFRAPQVAQGNYTFTVSADGYDTFTDPAVVLGQNAAGNQFTLAPAGAASAGGDIVVTAGRVQVADFERTTTGTVINVGDLATRVPVARNLNAIIQLAPGTVRGDSAFGDLPAVSGASVSENTFYINGLNITDFRKGLGAVTVPFEFYQTVEVKTGGYPAEFGRATGGFINAISKSGSNDFHGGVVVSYEPNQLRDKSPNTITADNDSDYRDRIDTTFYLSGPIIKDKLFFFGLYNPRYIKTSDGSISANRNDISTTTSPFFGGKVDFTPFDGQRLEFTYFDTSNSTSTDSYNFNPTTNVTSSYISGQVALAGGENYVARYTGTFAPWITVSGAYGKNKNRDATLSNNNTYPTIIENRPAALAVLFPNAATRPSSSNIGNPTNVVEASYDQRTFYRGDVDIYFNLLGTHHIRGGYDREELSNNSTQSYTGNVTYQYLTAGATSQFAPPGSDYYTARTRVVGGVFTGLNQAYYIEDNWGLFGDRLNLQLGVRNDEFKNRNALGVAFYDAKKQIAPRVGFTFDPTGDRRSKVYGSFGRYFLPLAANSSFLQTGGILDYTRYFTYAGMNADGTPIQGTPLTRAGQTALCPDTGIRNCTLSGDGTPKPAAANVSSTLKSQYVDEYILGAEQRLGERWRFGVNFTYRDLGRSLEDVAIDASVNNYCRAQNINCGTTRTSASRFTGFNQYVLVNPGSPITVQLFTPINGETTARTVSFSAAELGYPQAKRTYKAMTFTFDREYDGKWSLSGSYTLAASVGNAEGGVLSDIGQDDTGLTQSFDQPGLTDGTYGYLPGHRRHSFKAYGSYTFADWLTVGLNAVVESPRKFGCIGLHPTDVFAQAYGAASFYCRTDSSGNVTTNPANNNDATYPLTLTRRGTQFGSDWNKQIDLTVALKMPTDVINAELRLDAFNLLNFKSKLDFSEFGTDDDGNPITTYGSINSYQTARYLRAQLAIRF